MAPRYFQCGDDEPTASPPCEEFSYEFSMDVPANTTRENPATRERDVPYDGWVTELVLGWPNAANNLAGVQFRRASGERLFPRNPEDEYAAQNNFQHAYTICTQVLEEETLVAEFINNDSQNHFINVIATIRRRFD